MTITRPDVQPFFQAQSGTWTYVVHDGTAAAIVDPALDFDPASGRVGTQSAARVLAYVQERGLGVEWILETHAHADHLTAAAWLQARAGGRIAIGRGIRDVQAAFRDVLDLGAGFAVDGSQFDRLFEADERFTVGSLQGSVIATPGHTPDSVSYLLGDAVFIGDTLFMPDSGSARCDFPGADAATLYASVQRLYALPQDTRVFVCHDYPPGGREPQCETSIAAQRRGNIHLLAGTSVQEFAALRARRDAGLGAPARLYPALQVNLRAGRLPPPAANGRRYVRIPLTQEGT